MRSLTANVYITKSLPAIDKLFFVDSRLKTFSQKFKTLSKTQLEQSFVASPAQNDGLMDLEMSVTSNGNAAQGKGQTVTMRFLETSKLLEMFLLENDPLADLIDAKRKQVNKTRDPGQSTNVIATNFTDRKDIALEIQKANRYYLAFGTDDNVKNWAGPFTMQLAGATLKNDSNNVRIIELVFVPDLESYKSWSPKFGSVLGYNDNFQNLSQFVSEKDSYQAKASMRIRSCEGKIFNLDHRLRTLLKKYIATFTNKQGNAVVVFPDKFGKLEVFNPSFFEGGPGRSPTTVTKFFDGIFPDNVKGVNALRSTGVQISKFSLEDIPSSETPIKDGLNYLKDIGLEAVESFNQLSVNAKDLAKKALDTLRKGGQTAAAIKEAFKLERDKVRATKLYAIQEQFTEKESEADFIFEEAERIIDNASDQDLLQGLLNGQRENARTLGSNVVEELIGTATGQFKFNRIVFSYAIRNQLLELDLSTQTQALRSTLVTGTTIPARQIWNRANAESRVNRIAYAQKLKDNQTKKVENEYLQSLKPNSPENNLFLQKLEQDSLAKIKKDEEDARTAKKNLSPTLPFREGALRDFDIGIAQRRKNAKLKSLNLEANWDLVTESARNILVTNPKFITLELFIELRNVAAQEVYDGFSPLVAPLIKFAAGVKSLSKQKLKNTQYDFIEENDVRILKLWKKHGIIEDSSKPAFLYGDANEIRRLFYLEGGPPSDHTIETVFNLSLFDDNDGKTPQVGRPDVMTSKPTPSMLAGRARNKARRSASNAQYQAYIADFREQFPLPPMLVLRHNVPNANVLDLNYNVDKYQSVLLNLPVRPSLDEGYIGTSRLRIAKSAANDFVSESVKNALSKIDAPTFAEFVEQMVQSYQSTADVVASLVNSEAYDAIKNKKVIDLLSVLFFIQNADKECFENGEKVGVEAGISRKIDSNTLFDQYYEAILDQTMRLLYTCNVRTMPNFNQKTYLKRACELVGNTGGIVGFPEKLRQPAPYNGYYSVVGFKHVISTNNIYTEYDIVRVGMEHKFAVGDVKVKDFFCKILWDNLGISKERYYELFVDAKFADNIKGNDAVSVAGRAAAKVVDNAPQGGNSFNEFSAPGVNRKKYEGTLITPRFERIEKALKTMGCL